MTLAFLALSLIGIGFLAAAFTIACHDELIDYLAQQEANGDWPAVPRDFASLHAAFDSRGGQHDHA